jgi:hypothetical protein
MHLVNKYYSWGNDFESIMVSSKKHIDENK